jgi:hypothetical protein
MPYYVYRINAMKIMEKVAEYATFPEASKAAKALRAELADPNPRSVRVVFAKNELEAEDTVAQEKPFVHTGEDY